MIANIAKPRIKIPKVDEKEVFNVPSGWLGEINKKFGEIRQIVFSINIIVVMSLVAIIISLVGIFLDQMRFNNVVYKEYSEKIQTLDSIQEANSKLFEQNKQNQNIIIEQQKQIIEVIDKK